MSASVSIDRTVGAAYITLHDVSVARTVEINPSCFVDLDEFGCVIGVELLGPTAPSVSEISTRVHVKGEDLERLGKALALVPRYSLTSSSLTSRSRLHTSDSTGTLSV